MLNLPLSEIARWTNGQLHGVDSVVRGISTDTRTLQGGELFVALKGDRYDAHDFIATARAQGASAALVSRLMDVNLPQVLVTDVERALGAIAKNMHAQRTSCIVGITGSNGKTTVKALTESILRRVGRTHANQGNFNNEIGLPLTLLAMPQDTEFAVLEMGAGKPGDIAYLAAIAQPQIGLVNNIAAAHLERLGSLQGVAETKGALYTALPEDGTAVINADDAFAAYFTKLAGTRRVVRFGFDSSVDVSAVIHALGESSHFTLRTPCGQIPVVLPLLGKHNVLNALAASAIAIALQVPLPAIREGLESAEPVKGRLITHRSPSGWTLIDDSYNANPGSVAAAITALSQTTSEAWLILGDMKELGDDAALLHAEVGALAKRSGIARLYAVGELSRNAVHTFGVGAKHFSHQSALIDALRSELHADISCLVKGSRSSSMERVVAALLETTDNQGGERHAA